MEKHVSTVPSTNTRRFSLPLWRVVFLAALAYPCVASANITNSVPYTNSFEQYSHGFSLMGTNGWYAEETNALLIATNAANMYAGYLVYGTLPLTASTHTNILVIDGTVTNAITSGIGQVHYIDMMLLPRRWDEDKPPTVPSNDMKTAMFFDSNGFATVYGKYYSASNQTYVTNWITMTNYVVGTDQWVRLTVDMRMDLPEEWFRLRLDGFQLESEYGFVNAGNTNPHGAWLQVSVPNANHSISSLVFSGTAKLDDLQVITTNPIVGAKRSVTLSISPPGSAYAAIQEFTTYDAASVAFNDLAAVSINVLPYPYGTAYHLANVIYDGVSKAPDDPEWDAENNLDGGQIVSNHTYQAFLQAQPRTLVIAGYPSSLSYSGSPANGTYTNQFVYNQYVTCTSTVDSPLNTSTTRTACDAIRIVSRPGSTVSSTGTVGNTSLATTSFTLQDMNTDDPSATDVTTNLWRWHFENKLDTSVTGDVGFLESRGDGQVNVSDNWYDTNQTVTVTATPYNAGAGSWNFTGWQGATNGCAISSNTIAAPMTAPRDIAAYFAYSAASTQRTLTVNSDYGSPTPATGTVSYNDGTVVTCSVAGSPQLMGDATQYVCSGWTGSGHVPDSGSGTNVTIRLTEDSVITWNWAQQYRLLVNVTGPGSVDVSNATWHSVSAGATVIATPSVGATFAGWSGDTNDCTINGNEIQVTMDIPRTIAADFRSSYGVPGSWLAQYGLTNDTTDPDGDGALTWQEYVAGTDPTTNASVFRLLAKLSYTGSNYISWYGTTNSPIGVSIPPFEIYRSTNLVGGWGSAYATNITRATNGTTAWWDTNLPTQSVPLFYRPFITWTN